MLVKPLIAIFPPSCASPVPTRDLIPIVASGATASNFLAAGIGLIGAIALLATFAAYRVYLFAPTPGLNPFKPKLPTVRAVEANLPAAWAA